jgi:bacterioferritin-associated ferredoxin
MISLTTQTTLEVETECEGVCRSCPSVGSCAERLVCRCLKVTEHEVVTAIRRHGLSTVQEVKAMTKAGDGCRCCHRELHSYLAIYASSSPLPSMCSAK